MRVVFFLLFRIHGCHLLTEAIEMACHFFPLYDVFGKISFLCLGFPLYFSYMKNISEGKKDSREIHFPKFFALYSVLVMVLLFSMFLVFFLVVITSKKEYSSFMLQAVLMIQLFGIAYFLPFYFVPEILSLFKHKKSRRRNIILLVCCSLMFVLFYPLFRLLLLFF